jgi:hypothetical protein
LSINLAYDCINNWFTNAADDPRVYLATSERRDESKLLLEFPCYWLTVVSNLSSSQPPLGLHRPAAMESIATALVDGMSVACAVLVDCRLSLLQLQTKDTTDQTHTTSAIMMQ